MKKAIKKYAPIGRRIRAFRQKRGLNISELAKKAGMSRPYLSQLELEDVDNPTIEIIQRIADALDVTVSELLGERNKGKKISSSRPLESPFNREELERMVRERDLKNVKILDQDTQDTVLLIAEILSDSEIPIKYIREMQENIASYARWLRDEMKEKAATQKNHE